MYGIGFSCIYLSLNGDSCQLFRNNSTIFSFNFFHPLLGVSLFMLLPFSLPEIFQSESFWCNMIIEICVPVFVDVFRVFVTYLICAHWMALRLNLHNSENEARRTYLFFDFSLALSLSLSLRVLSIFSVQFGQSVHSQSCAEFSAFFPCFEA